LPFTNFWFDDNWLARYMSQAYNKPVPNGLSQYNDFTRWAVIGGTTASWTPYSGGLNPDQYCLNGLYYIARQDWNAAMTSWNGVHSQSQATWDASNQQYSYPGIKETYYFGLWAILTGFLRLDHPDAKTRALLLQHYISIRSSIFALQVRGANGNLCSWVTNIPAANSLINTETTATNTLGLAAGSSYVFEVGDSPLHSDDASYFKRPYYAVSAVVGLSKPGYLSRGPYMNFGVGDHQVEFILRSPSPTGVVAVLDVNDAQANAVLATLDVSQFAGQDWCSFIISFHLSNPNNSLEFRIHWEGKSNLDASIIRLF